MSPRAAPWPRSPGSTTPPGQPSGRGWKQPTFLSNPYQPGASQAAGSGSSSGPLPEPGVVGRRDRGGAGHQRPPRAAHPARTRHPGPQGRATATKGRGSGPATARGALRGSRGRSTLAPPPHPASTPGRHNRPTVPHTSPDHAFVPVRGVRRDRFSCITYRAADRPTCRTGVSAASRLRDPCSAVGRAFSLAEATTR